VLGASPLLSVAWFAPMAIGGLILATCGGFVLHRLSGTMLMVISALGYLTSVLLFALIPTSPNYWAWIFPAMISGTIGGDIAYSVTNVFITSNVPKDQQGIAGAFINSLVYLGISLMLGIADNVAAQALHLGIAESYHSAFWFAVGCAGCGLAVVVIGVRIDEAKSDLTAEEKAEMQKRQDL
jgi:MFS family permease